MIETLNIKTNGSRLYDVTQLVHPFVRDYQNSEGLCTLFVRHTSCSLLIQENADPSVQTDLIHWMNRLVPENDPLYTHTLEGPDDMPAHIKAVLTQTHLTIPFHQNELLLGGWQGIYLWEHRNGIHQREVVVHL